MENEDLWKVIHKYFEDNPQNLVTHHIESYNDFFKHGIFGNCAFIRKSL